MEHDVAASMDVGIENPTWAEYILRFEPRIFQTTGDTRNDKRQRPTEAIIAALLSWALLGFAAALQVHLQSNKFQHKYFLGG